MTPKELGIYGEELATLHLIKEGYTILDRNWYAGKNEIDIVCEKEPGVLVIVEVKARNSDFFGDPHTFVSAGKQKTIVKVADVYVLENDLDVEVRFDVIGVLKNKTQQKLVHYEDAFYYFQ
jgi:putative endonuclease